MNTTKKCCRCGDVKPLAQFYPHKETRDRANSSCIVCDQTAAATWRAEHPEYAAKQWAENRDQMSVAHRSWREAKVAENPDFMKLRHHRYYEANPSIREKAVARAAAYNKAHPEWRRLISRASGAKRRAQKAGVAATLTTAQVSETFAAFNHACAYCLRTDAKLTIDHVIPLSRGGAHTQENIVPACQPCNSRKHARGPLAMLNQHAA